MRKLTTILILVSFFGCKNKPNNKIVSSAVVKIENSKNQPPESIFDLIVNKKETSNFPDSIFSKFDFSKRFTKKEISILKLDTTKIDLSEYYFLSNQKFLKKQIDSISFLVYYKHRYGDQLEKILRVVRKDSFFDLTLSMQGGDSFSQSISTEFINESTFVSISVDKEKDPDSNSFYVDSIISFYNYTPNLNFKLIHKDTFKIENDIVSKMKIPFGKVNNYGFFYDCLDCRLTTTGAVNIYTIKNNFKTELVNIPIADYYIDDVKLIELKNKPFILVHSTHTYGHSEGKLFSFDTDKIKLNKVNIKKNNFVIPDSLSIRKGFGLSYDENQFTTGYFLRSENNGNGFSLITTYNLIKVKENEYELVPVKTEMNEAN